MVPHPTTWQAARERQRQDLLASAERHHHEAIALAEDATRVLAARSGFTSGRLIPDRAMVAEMLAPVAHAIRGKKRARRWEARPNGPRLLARLLTMFVAALLVLPIPEGTPTAEAGKKFKTITKTFSSNGQIDIPDAGGWKLEISAKVKNDETQNKN